MYMIPRQGKRHHRKREKEPQQSFLDKIVQFNHFDTAVQLRKTFFSRSCKFFVNRDASFQSCSIVEVNLVDIVRKVHSRYDRYFNGQIERLTT